MVSDNDNTTRAIIQQVLAPLRDPGSVPRATLIRTRDRMLYVGPNNNEEENYGPWLRHLAQNLNSKDLADYDFLAGLARELILAGQSLPPPLDRFVVDIIDGKRKRSARGPRFYELQYRDALIVAAVDKGVRAGLNATRNESTEGENSACDLVADCLHELGFDLSYKAVAKIWAIFHGSILKRARTPPF